ncbi:hypothetical protein [Gilliamella sp. B2838]|uniref:hypothetical protein n=1 Tax=Gilliamella sp. B2838 TaxID=2818020 RepID=UPI00226A1E44|nr:hypothetical protein [Gilliamella sp. B2838]MCX8727409.1 hypothetical protein [Gilliamella sp. B2838]
MKYNYSPRRRENNVLKTHQSLFRLKLNSILTSTLNLFHQSKVTRHRFLAVSVSKRCTFSLALCYRLLKAINLRLILRPTLIYTQTQASGQLSKLALASMPWLLLLYATTTQALSVTTVHVIHGSEPYLTFDNGVTKVTTTEGLLGITLSDGTQYTPSTNPSTVTPIVLPGADQSFADIGMLVPTDTNSVDLNTLIDSNYNYWGDDDGDSDVTATGSLSLSIVDKNNRTVSRNTVPMYCNAPYKATLTSAESTLTTRYGFPNSIKFGAGNVSYYFNPKESPGVCFAKPSNLVYNIGIYAGPENIWHYNKGFLTQTATPSSYSSNFPTTGANGLFFDLDISNTDQALTWEPVSHSGITATMTNSTKTSVRVTLTGPAATSSQWNSRVPDKIAKPSLPQTFELVGRDSSGNAVAKYGFELKQWFVNRGTVMGNYNDQLSWCKNIGYELPNVRDLTNAVYPYDDIISATPVSSGNYFQRHIGAGLFSEWGYMLYYTNANFYWYYWTNDKYSHGDYWYYAHGDYGLIHWVTPAGLYYGICASELKP